MKCMCNVCKGQISFHRNTCSKHVEQYGLWEPDAPGVGDTSTSSVSAMSAVTTQDDHSVSGSSDGDISDSSSSETSSRSSGAPAAKRARTVSPLQDNTNEDDRRELGAGKRLAPLCDALEDANEQPHDTTPNLHNSPQPLDNTQQPLDNPQQPSNDPQQPDADAHQSAGEAPQTAVSAEELEQQQQLQAEEDLMMANNLDTGTMTAQPFTGAQTFVEEEAPAPSMIDHIWYTQEFTKDIEAATLDNGKLSQDCIDHLRSPEAPDVSFSDEDVRLCLAIYIAASRTSEKVYEGVLNAIWARWPDEDSVKLMSIYEVRKAVEEVSGVHPILDDMFVNGCEAFTGPLSEETKCMNCGEERWTTTSRGKKVPRKQATTFPLGPQLAALRRSKESAKAMHYRHNRTQALLAEKQR
ncbi:hypothetical protein NMY22_g14216 [Coprinellus aureogranulatus]|nr:hypothetical protein NMY22_g14216 [Coprinellus aureogranulatus]